MKNIFTLIILFAVTQLHSQNSIKNTSVIANCGSCTGSYTWNTSAIFNPTIMISGPGFTKDLQSTNYGFSIPSNATITGIHVTFNHSHMYTHPTALNDTLIRLLKGGVPSGHNKIGVTGPYNQTVTTTENFGGTGDLWGTTWTPTDINSANFGFDLKMHALAVGNLDMYISQGFIITVYYTIPSGINEYQTRNSHLASVFMNERTLKCTGFEKLSQVSMQLFDINGKHIMNIDPKQNTQADFSLLTEGIYFVKVTSMEESWTKKLLLR